MRIVNLIWMPELHLLKGAATWRVRGEKSYSDMDITERPDRNERWLSVLLVISIIAFVIVVPGLTSGFGYMQDNVILNDRADNAGSLSSISGSTPEDDLFTGQDDYSLREGTGRIYCIIVGSYVNPENAGNAVEKYNSLGYRTSIITTTLANGGKAELVAVRIFSNYNDAASFLSEFRSRVAPEAWIFSN